MGPTAPPHCHHDAKNFRCVTFLRNYDGDTIVVDIPDIHALFGKNISVRVAGIDTAELHGKAPCEKVAGDKAREFVQTTLKSARHIDLINVGRDKYFRILADVQADGVSIAAALLKNKLAVPYDGKAKMKVNWCDASR